MTGALRPIEPEPAESAVRPDDGRPYLAPVPDSLPPFEDDTDQHGHPLPRPWGIGRPRNPPQVPRQMRRTDVPGWSDDPDVGVKRTDQTSSGAESAGGRFARALVEIWGRNRPLAQLRSHCSAEVYAGLEIGGLPQRPIRLRSVRVMQPAPGVGEVCAVVRTGQRTRALAFRIESLDGRWRITDLITG